MRKLYGNAQNHQLGLGEREGGSSHTQCTRERGGVHVPVWRRYSLERVHPQGHVHAGAVGQQSSQSRFLKQPKDQNLIPARQVRAERKVMYSNTLSREAINIS